MTIEKYLTTYAEMIDRTIRSILQAPHWQPNHSTRRLYVQYESSLRMHARTAGVVLPFPPQR